MSKIEQLVNEVCEGDWAGIEYEWGEWTGQDFNTRQLYIKFACGYLILSQLWNTEYLNFATYALEKSLSTKLRIPLFLRIETAEQLNDLFAYIEHIEVDMSNLIKRLDGFRSENEQR